MQTDEAGITICPVCGQKSFPVVSSADALDDECQYRERFIKRRLERPASAAELKDLTNFFHQAGAEILRCEGCSLLIRHELGNSATQNYAEEEYEPEVMESVYPQYLRAFRAKDKPYRELLGRGARIIEVGSHYGAFLQVAGEWGWNAEGIDIGADTSQFARSKGLTVHTRELTECRFTSQTLDGVFVWNCFEQLDDPKSLLKETKRILKPGGLLTVRTPNGLFYSHCRNLLAEGQLQPQVADFLLEALAYNNLLGFPYLYGHSMATLQRLIEPYGFKCEGMLNSELITLPLPDSPEWVEREERAINGEMKMLANSFYASQDGALIGPWIELWFRAV